MPRRASRQRGISGRGAFTMVELLLASTISALTATAGAGLVFAIANAAQNSRDIRATVSAGHYGLNRVGETVREARAIGQVLPGSMTLWVQDNNANDQMTLNEIAVIRYDAGAKQVLYQYTTAASASSTAVTYANFTNYTAMSAQISGAGLQSTVWCSGVETCSLTAYPSLTDTRVVELHFTIGTGADEVAFQVAASPKASGDYLFLADTRANPTAGSNRARRQYYSIWDGFQAYPTTINVNYITPPPLP
jgi:hypothetical protein